MTVDFYVRIDLTRKDRRAQTMAETSAAI